MPNTVKFLNDKIKLSLAFFLLTLPLYFKAPYGLQWPLIGLIISLPLAIGALIKQPVLKWVLIAYLSLGFFQLFFLGVVDINAFVRKFIAIVLFILTFGILLQYYNQKYDKYVYFGLLIVIIYGFYSSFSYIFGYQDYLFPGTCGANNLSDIGHLRCATFGEGNYLGGYIALLTLIYSRQFKFRVMCLIGAVISWSPTPIILILYTNYRQFIEKVKVNKRIKTSIDIMVFASIGFAFLLAQGSVYEMLNNASERSSLGERLEFIRAGLAMWLDNPIVGVGFGNYGYYLPQYTLFQHLMDRTLLEDARFIANNNIIEFLSEQGIIGFMFYIYVLFRASKVIHPTFSRQEVILLLVFIGLTMPTFFQIIVAALLGILASKHDVGRKSTF
jgi:O-antigen ligase